MEDHPHPLSLGDAGVGAVSTLLLAAARGALRDLPSLLAHALLSIVVGLAIALLKAKAARRWPQHFGPVEGRRSTPPGGDPPAPSSR